MTDRPKNPYASDFIASIFDIDAGHFAALVSGDAFITPDDDRKLCQVSGNTVGFFLRLQQAYLDMEEKRNHA